MARRKSTASPATDYEPFIRRVEMRWDKVENRECYPWNLPFLRRFEALDFAAPVTFFVGENGSGKSTLLEGIAEAHGLNSEGGSRNHSFATTRHRSPIADCLRLVRGTRRPRFDFFLRAESLYNVLTNYESMPGEPLSHLHSMSHGEGFLELLAERFSDGGLYLMDEPEAALSPQHQLTLLCRMAQLVATGAQFIIATHSPVLLAFPRARLVHFSPDGLSPINYRETDHYLITRRVLEDPEGYMARLLDEVDS